MHLDQFSDLISKYEAFFFDAFGVLKNYKGLIPGVPETFAHLREQQKLVYILTNDASRSPQQLAESYGKLGMTDITPDMIISSGMLAREYLELKVDHGTVAYLGTEDSAHYIETAGLKTLSMSQLTLENIAEVNALVLLDDEGFDWNTDISKAVNLLRRRNIPAIVANTDATYPVSKNRVSIAIGAVADMLESIVGKRFIRFGKPDAQLFMFAFEQLRQVRLLTKRDILMVGDTLKTDILGGNTFGLDTVLVLSGNTQQQEAEMLISGTGIIPTYVCPSISLNPEA